METLIRVIRRIYPGLVLTALAIVPLMYSGALIAANRNPTENLDGIPAAIVNADLGATLTKADDTTTELALGDEVVDALLHPDPDAASNLDWHLVSAEEAAEGLAEARYYAVLDIPAGFSAAVASSMTVDPGAVADAARGQLTITTNDATNYITGTIASSIAKSLATSLNGSVVQEYLDAVYLGFTTVHDSLGDAVDGAAELADGALSASDGADALRDGLATLRDKSAALPSGVAQLRDGAATAAAGTSSLASGLADLDAGAARVAAGADAALTGAEGLQEKLETLAAGYDVMTDEQRKALIAGLAAGAGGLVGTVEDGTGLAALAAGAGQLAAGASDASTGAAALQSGLGALSGGLGSLAGSAPALVTGIGSAATGASDLADGIRELADGSGELASGLADGVDEIPAFTDGQSRTLAEIAAEPVEVDAVRDNAVDGYGAGLMPYFLGLGLWVGAMGTFFMRPALHERSLATGRTWLFVAARSAAPVLAVAVAQALLASLVVNAVLDIGAADVAGLAGMAVLTAVTFMMINLALIVLVGPVGRFIALLLTILQLTAAGGTYPVQTAPEFFQAMHDIVPLSHAMQAFRSLIAGSGYGVADAAATLTTWLVGALVILLAGSFITVRKHAAKRLRIARASAELRAARAAAPAS